MIKMSWKNVIKSKEEPVHINFLSEDKLMAWVNGRGPYTVRSIYANLKKNGTFEDRREFLDGKRLR